MVNRFLYKESIGNMCFKWRRDTSLIRTQAIFLSGVFLLSSLVFAGKTFRSEKCRLESFDGEIPEVESPLEITGYGDWLPSHKNSFSEQFPHVSAEIRAKLASYAEFNPMMRDMREQLRHGTIQPLEAFDRIAHQHEAEILRLEQISMGLNRASRERGENPRHLKSVLHNFWLKNTINVGEDEIHHDLPWYVGLQRKVLLEKRTEVEKYHTPPPLGEEQIRKITEFAVRWPSLLAEVDAALRLPDIRYGSVHGGELENLKLLKKDLPKEFRTAEIDLIGEEGKGMVLYEVKRYQSRKVGEEVNFNETLAQMNRLKEISELMRLKTRVKMVSYTGYTPEARKILEHLGIELMGPP